MWRGSCAVLLAAFVPAVGACSHDWDKLEPNGRASVDASVGGQAGSSGSSGSGGGAGVGGVGGVGGAGGVDGGAGTGGVPATCTDKTMVPLSAGLTKPFCIDRTEVTNTEYEAFLSPSPDPSSQPANCSWNTDFTPSNGWPPAAGTAGYPVAFVDWCDATAYCAHVGKRLCGRIGGGAVPFSSPADPAISEWFNACSGGGSLAYPYGDTYSGNACNGTDFGANGPTTAGSTPGCEGAPKGLFDMSGNLFEWEDSCSDNLGANSNCRIRGGAYNNNAANLRCDIDATATRDSATVTIGFRCCTDAVVN
ncbi:MAG: SUMF1/EgtB/PvdO family nonheme iron enzyme [Polyangiaceae bacterium]